jgi:arylformamidase
MRRFVLAIGVVAVLTGGAALAERERLPRECRREVLALCGLSLSREKLRECLTGKVDALSERCRNDIIARVREQMGSADRGARRAPAAGAIEYAYGSAPLQRFDFFPAKASKAPLVMFVHGGGWKRGDKGNAAGRDLVPHYAAQGYAVAAVNYRLVPEATVEQQAADVAGAVAWARTNAARLGIDPERIVLMGHSAGAHLVALVGTDPQYLGEVKLGLDAIRGVIPNDGAAYDVPTQMSDGPKLMQSAYVQAFGTDLARQRALSPTLHAVGPNAPAFLLIHVQRPDGTRQAASLAEALRRAGTPVQVSGFAGEGLKGHMEINRRLGDPAYPATPVVDAWLTTLFR